MEADHHGAFVSIDVDSGSWAISDDLMTAAKRLREQRPEAIDVYSVRVGVWGAASLWGPAAAGFCVIQGVVNAAHEAVITLSVQGPEGAGPGSGRRG